LTVALCQKYKIGQVNKIFANTQNIPSVLIQGNLYKVLVLA